MGFALGVMANISKLLVVRVAKVCVLVIILSIGCLVSEDPGCDCSCPPPPPGENCDPCCRPIVNAGDDQAAAVGQTIVLRGSVRVPPENRDVCIYEKDALTYQWEQVGGPDIALQDSEQRDAFFVAQEEGEYVFRFKATYPLTDINAKMTKVSEWDEVSVVVSEAVCGPPFAEAGEDQVVSTTTGNPVTIRLEGNKSHVTNQSVCEYLQIESFLWTVASQPAGANVEIANSAQAEASVDLTVPGIYEFQLEVRDDGGTAARADIDTDVVTVTLLQSPVCEGSLVVTVVDSRDSTPIPGAHATVVDADGVSHVVGTDAAGVASFENLAPGSRQYITVVSDEAVPALPGTPDSERPRFETTTVLDHCSSELTVPLRLTASGKSEIPKGTVTAKVPGSIFNMLPHSWKCAGECASDADCPDSYYCETEETCCKDTCTPRSLLPFFSLGDHEISGQIRFAWLVPAYPLKSSEGPSLDRLFTATAEWGSLFPSNLATDDTFLNGLAPSLGRSPWGGSCINESDCPNEMDYRCEQDPQGDYLCRDKNPLRNFRMEVPAGQGVRLSLVAGVIDIDMYQLLPTLLPVLTTDHPFAFGDLGFLESFEVKTLHVCPLAVDVASGQENDITQNLAAIAKDDCWSVDYTYKDSVVALKDLIAPVEGCESDADCCASWDECGFLESGRKCLRDPDYPSQKGCFTPLFRVDVFTEERVTVVPSGSGFDPLAERSDERLCSWLPEFAPYEELCEHPDYYYIYRSCEPPRYHDLEVPDNAECSFRYGLTLMTLDIPKGHAALPDGGHLVVGFDVHRTTDHTREPEFLVPSLRANALEGASITALQSYLRRAEPIPDGRYQAMGGYLSATSSLGSLSRELEMPGYLAQPVESSVVDVGLDVTVTFIPEDPTIWPDPVLTRVYSVADAMRLPVWSVNDLPEALTVSTDPDSNMMGIVLSRVDRIDVQIEESHWEGELVVEDPLWRIYAPAGTTSISLPQEFNPFRIRNEVWVAPWAGSFSTLFDYNLFLTDQVLGHMSSYAEDSYALIAP
jgi:hypothetical protein